MSYVAMSPSRKKLWAPADGHPVGSIVVATAAHDPDSGDVWYTDTQRGFFVVHLTKATGIKHFARVYMTPGS